MSYPYAYIHSHTYTAIHTQPYIHSHTYTAIHTLFTCHKCSKITTPGKLWNSAQMVWDWSWSGSMHTFHKSVDCLVICPIHMHTYTAIHTQPYIHYLLVTNGLRLLHQGNYGTLLKWSEITTPGKLWNSAQMV